MRKGEERRGYHTRLAKTRSRLNVVVRPISELKPDGKNARSHSPKQIRQIARSIEAFGFNVPLLVDANSRVIAGHGRLEACRQLGFVEVPTIMLEHLSEAQVRAFMIADNRLTENSSWDDRLLAEQLKELSIVDLDFDLEATGFEMGEIDLRIESLSEEEGSKDDADALPDESHLPSVSRLGDGWLLGRHQVLCANSLEERSYAKLMGDEPASAVVSDLPFNVAIAGNVSGLGAIRHRDFAMAAGEMSPDQFVAFLKTALGLLAQYSTDGSLHYLFMDWRHLGELLQAGSSAYTELKNVCVWAKDTAGMGSLYRSAHELIFVYKSGRGAHRNNIQLGKFGRNRTNVWNYPGALGLRSSEEGNLLALHPTVKPTKLIADAILDCTARGDLVLDAFLGSGTTLIAAERVGRRCNGLELDPIYVDTIVRRWQGFTGDAARHAASGRTFAECEKEAQLGDGN
jgi:DNA modification methylase